MLKTATVRARIQPELKNHVENVFSKLGLTVTEAITLFFKQVELRKGLPFPIEIPNKITEQTFKDTDAGKNLVHCKNAENMFRKLEK